MATVLEPMTTEAMLALPNADVQRWLIDGELREKPMTVRNRFHTKVLSRICFVLERWRDAQPGVVGDVHSGEAGVRLHRDPDTTVGVDAVYISPELANQQSEETTLIEGIPTLAVEILSPNDTVEDIEEKLGVYLKAGVPLVWIVHPYQKTVMIHRPGQQPVLVNSDQELDGEPHLPGFRVPVAELFR